MSDTGFTFAKLPCSSFSGKWMMKNNSPIRYLHLFPLFLNSTRQKYPKIVRIYFQEWPLLQILSIYFQEWFLLKIPSIYFQEWSLLKILSIYFQEWPFVKILSISFQEWPLLKILSINFQEWPLLKILYIQHFQGQHSLREQSENR